MLYTEENIKNKVFLSKKCFSELAMKHLELVKIGNVKDAECVWGKMVAVWGAISAMCGW